MISCCTYQQPSTLAVRGQHKLVSPSDDFVHAQWVGYIKDYDGGTLMECIIGERLPYTDLPGMLRAQRAALDRHIRTLSKSHVVHPGLAAFRNGQRRVDVSSIPGERGHIGGCEDS